MSGILDSKTRIMDTIVTAEGRRQLSRGALKIRYAMFTDQDAFYEYDSVSGSTDASQRVHFEAFNRPQDVITFEADDVGNLNQAPGGTFGVLGGQVLIPGGAEYDAFMRIPNATDMQEKSYALLSASFDSFHQQYAISMKPVFDDVNEFNLSVDSIEFTIVDDMYDGRQGFTETSIDNVESFIQDWRLSHAPNYQYMPPVNASTPSNPRGSHLGMYPRLDQAAVTSIDDVMSQLDGRDRTTIRFSETSADSNLFGQFFNVRTNKILKLDVIDFGEFVAADGLSRHVMFAGRIYRDSRGAHTFVNIFTLIFS